jgi:hypothetical protein
VRPRTRRGIDLAVQLGLLAVGIAAVLLALIGIATAAGYVPQ